VTALTLRALNRALLARQWLLEPRAAGAAEAVEHLVAVQAQDPQAPYGGLAARVAGFDPHELSDLLEAGDVVRGTLHRGTLHLVTTRDYAWLRPTLQSVLERRFAGSAFGRRTADVDAAEARALARAELAGGPLPGLELGRRVAARLGHGDAEAVSYLVRYLEPLVQPPPRGLYGRGGRAEVTLPPVALAAPDPPRLVRRYLAAFGPSTPADFAAWSGLAGARELFERLRGELRTPGDADGRELFDLPDGALADPGTPAPPRRLPVWDNVLYGHADRRRVVPPQHDSRIMRRVGWGPFLVDGFVAGEWRDRDGAVQLEPYEPLAPAAAAALVGAPYRCHSDG
jgi:winged helix DNA-binding protein